MGYVLAVFLLLVTTRMESGVERTVAFSRRHGDRRYERGQYCTVFNVEIVLEIYAAGDLLHGS